MCLITFSWQRHPKYPLVLVANRDEFFTRPAMPLHRWSSGLYAGKDLKGGGTWMGCHPDGRFAALTNYRDLNHLKENPISRGELVLDFLESNMTPQGYLEKVKSKQGKYNGFNLIVADPDQMWYLSNYGNGAEKVFPGVHGISNALMDEAWKKVVDSKSKLLKKIGENEFKIEDLEEVHMSTEEEQLENLPDTGLPKAIEKAVSAPFIRPINRYGTVNVSVMLWDYEGRVTFSEKKMSEDGSYQGRVFTFSFEGP